jgi:DNA polymerase
LRREDVYIANVVKCRPPNNRNPEPDEIGACWDTLEKQIEIIQPKIICTLGKFAAQTLLQTLESITALRGKWFFYKKNREIKIIPTFHPAYLLRNEAAKRPVWEDFKKIKAALI